MAVATDKKTGKCNVCDQEGHWARGCPVIEKYKKFHKDKQSTRESNDKKEVVVVADEEEEPSLFCFKEIVSYWLRRSQTNFIHTIFYATIRHLSQQRSCVQYSQSWQRHRCTWCWRSAVSEFGGGRKGIRKSLFPSRKRCQYSLIL